MLQKGTSIFEILIVLTILTIIFLQIVPVAKDDIITNQVQKDSNSFWHLLKKAKSLAIYKGINITVCPLDNSNACNKQWQTYAIKVFIDNNNNKVLNTDDVILHSMQISENTTLTWRARNRYIIFNNLGTVNQFGSFKYCKYSNQNTYGFKLIISRSARVRKEDSTAHC